MSLLANIIQYDRESIKSDFSLADAGLIFYRGGDCVDENMDEEPWVDK